MNVKNQNVSLLSEEVYEDGNEKENLHRNREEELEFDPARIADRKAVSEIVASILDSLALEQKTAMWMVYGQQITIKELAEELGVSENTIKSRLYQGRQKLYARKAEFRKYGIELAAIPVSLLVAMSFEDTVYAAEWVDVSASLAGMTGGEEAAQAVRAAEAAEATGAVTTGGATAASGTATATGAAAEGAGAAGTGAAAAARAVGLLGKLAAASIGVKVAVAGAAVAAAAGIYAVAGSSDPATAKEPAAVVQETVAVGMQDSENGEDSAQSTGGGGFKVNANRFEVGGTGTEYGTSGDGISELSQDGRWENGTNQAATEAYLEVLLTDPRFTGEIHHLRTVIDFNQDNVCELIVLTREKVDAEYSNHMYLLTYDGEASVIPFPDESYATSLWGVCGYIPGKDQIVLLDYSYDAADGIQLNGGVFQYEDSDLILVQEIRESYDFYDIPGITDRPTLELQDETVDVLRQTVFCAEDSSSQKNLQKNWTEHPIQPESMTLEYDHVTTSMVYRDPHWNYTIWVRPALLPYNQGGGLEQPEYGALDAVCLQETYVDVDDTHSQTILTAYTELGEQLWSYTGEVQNLYDYESYVTLGVRGGHVYLTEKGTVIALDAATGEKLWENTDLKGAPIAWDVDWQGNLYLCEGIPYTLHKITPEGETVFQVELDLENIDSEVSTYTSPEEPVLYYDDATIQRSMYPYAVTCDSGRVYIIYVTDTIYYKDGLIEKNTNMLEIGAETGKLKKAW